MDPLSPPSVTSPGHDPIVTALVAVMFALTLVKTVLDILEHRRSKPPKSSPGASKPPTAQPQQQLPSATDTGSWRAVRATELEQVEAEHAHRIDVVLARQSEGEAIAEARHGDHDRRLALVERHVAEHTRGLASLSQRADLADHRLSGVEARCSIRHALDAPHPGDPPR